jgi:hypothetical protein
MKFGARLRVCGPLPFHYGGCPISPRFRWGDVGNEAGLDHAGLDADRDCRGKDLSTSHISRKAARYPDFLYAAPSDGHVCGFH